MKVVFLFLVTFCTGCAFNKLYLYPTELDRAQKKGEVYDFPSEQTLSVVLGDHFQPTFYDSLNRSFELDYRIKSVEFLNQKGDSLHGWFITPKGKSNRRTIFYLHGNAGNIYSQYSLMLPFVKAGYTIFVFDYSGFGYSQGKAKRKNVYNDALDAFDYLQAQKEYMGDELVVYGQSLGGHLTASIGSIIQDKVDLFVIEGAFSSHDEVGAKVSKLGWFAKMMIREMYSGEELISEITKPKLIIHSNEDETVPFYMGKILFEKAVEPKEFYEIDGKHVLGPILYPDSIARRMNNYLN